MLSIAVPAGLLIGLLLGAVGGGGSILTVAVQVCCTGNRTRPRPGCAATSLYVAAVPAAIPADGGHGR